MKASPLIFLLCLGVGTANAGGLSMAPGNGGGHAGGGGHLAGGGHAGGGGLVGGRHGHSGFSPVNAVSDIENGPDPTPPQAPPPLPDPASFAPPPAPDPGFLPPPFLPAPASAPAPVWRPHSGPQILYLRKPKSNRAGPTVIYGSG